MRLFSMVRVPFSCFMVNSQQTFGFGLSQQGVFPHGLETGQDGWAKELADSEKTKRTNSVILLTVRILVLLIRINGFRYGFQRQSIIAKRGKNQIKNGREWSNISELKRRAICGKK